MALFLTKDLDDDAHSRLGIWHITETEAELKALSSIPSDELEEISFIKSESLRKQKLAVRALLDAMFEEKVYLSHHDNGKPYRMVRQQTFEIFEIVGCTARPQKYRHPQI